MIIEEREDTNTQLRSESESKCPRYETGGALASRGAPASLASRAHHTEKSESQCDRWRRLSRFGPSITMVENGEGLKVTSSTSWGRLLAWQTASSLRAKESLVRQLDQCRLKLLPGFASNCGSIVCQMLFIFALPGHRRACVLLRATRL